MSDDIVIRRVSNGAVVTWGGGGDAAFVFEEEDAEGLAEMLCQISEAFLPHNRHAEQQIAVHLRHGDKYVCEKGCDICKPEELREV